MRMEKAWVFFVSHSGQCCSAECIAYVAWGDVVCYYDMIW